MLRWAALLAIQHQDSPYILGLRPSIDITYQSNNSNIPFFSYNKLFGGVFFKNMY